MIAKQVHKSYHGESYVCNKIKHYQIWKTNVGRSEEAHKSKRLFFCEHSFL